MSSNRSALLDEKHITIIGVVGADKCSADIGRIAEEVNAEVARRNCILICGSRGGVMKAACTGA